MKKAFTLMMALMFFVALSANAQDTFYFEEEEASISDYGDGEWYIQIFDEEDNLMSISYNSDTFDGTFSTADCIMDCCFFHDPDYNFDYFTSINFSISGKTDGGYEITGTTTGENGRTYVFHVKKSVLEPKATVEVQATVENVVLDDGEGRTIFSLTSEAEPGVTYQICTYGQTGEFVEGNINKEMTYRKDAEGNIAQYNNGSMYIAGTYDNGYKLNGDADFIMEDTVEYKIKFSYELPTDETKQVTTTNCKLDAEWLEYEGMYWFRGSNSEFTSIEAQCMPESLEIEEQDFTSDNITFYLVDKQGNYISSMIIKNAHQSIDPESYLPIITATFLGNDCKEYEVNLSFKVPEKKGDKYLTFEDMTFNNLLESEGVFQVMGNNTDDTYFGSMAVYSYEVAGEYSYEDGSFAEGYTYVSEIDPETGDYTDVEFLSGNATVTMDEDGKINIQADFFGYDGYEYHLTMTSQYDKPHKTYDATEGDIDVTFTPEDCDTMYYNEDAANAYFKFENKDRLDIFEMVIYSEEEDPETIVPEGTYEVNTTYEPGTVQPGQFYYYDVIPTYYGTMDEDGYTNLPFWFLTEGTVTIKNTDGKLSFEVDGINSNDCKMHIVYDGTGAGINTVNGGSNAASVKKVAEGNQIVIMKGSRKYNVAGQTVK